LVWAVGCLDVHAYTTFCILPWAGAGRADLPGFHLPQGTIFGFTFHVFLGSSLEVLLALKR